MARLIQVQPPTVLVIGAGFLGAAITRSLVDRGSEVIVLTRSAPGVESTAELSDASVFIGDVREPSTIAPLLREVAHVVYAVGSSTPAQSDLDPAEDITAVVPPLVRLLDLVAEEGPAITFLSSGGAIYGNVPALPASEDAHLQPISSYGIVKLACENYLRMYRTCHGVDARVVRISNAYGPRQRTTGAQGLVARAFEASLTGEVVPLYGGTTAVRDYVYVDDAARAVAALVSRTSTAPVINIGTGCGHTGVEVLECVGRVTGHPIQFENFAKRTFDVEANVLDISLLEAHVPFSPRTLEDGVIATWDALRGLAPQLSTAESSRSLDASC